ncbi:MAG: glycoside hydrolase family 3 C-terminal domain-containing protein, partial [Acidobacteriaceae bacterium]|nr:glycoside hydrolase family 3 C-terminal domain-containing protein [Acidobacteriaceae bacterium]
MNRLSFLFGLLLLCVGGVTARAQQCAPPFPDVEQRVQQLMPRLSMEQKIQLLTGSHDMYIDGLDAIGLPRIKLSDGPTGVRVWGPSTAYPAGIALAASWDPKLIEEVGHSLGKDARARGVHILLAPGMNIYRAPMGGRNFEYFGEDPFLASRSAVAYICGVQAEGVVATAKHYVANDSEYDRHNVNAVVDERTLREIYLPPFEASVKDAHVAAFMDSYNLLNGEHTTQNKWLNNEVLKKEWGFDGILMSDWDATYDSMGAATAGLDLEMPTAKFMSAEFLRNALATGKLQPEVIDDKVRRILRTYLRFGFFDRPQQDLSIPLYSQQARRTALNAARESMVLLKNDHVLPLDVKKVRTVAVIGPNAFPAVPGGGGSSFTEPFAASSFLTGISDNLAGKVKVLYSSGLPTPEAFFKDTEFMTPDGKPGLLMETFSNREFAGTPVADTVRRLNRWGFRMWTNGSPAHQTIRWSGTYMPKTSGTYLMLVATGSGDTYHITMDGQDVLTQKHAEGTAPKAAQINLNADTPVRVVVEYRPGSSNVRIGFGIRPMEDLVLPEAKKIAAMADAVIVSVGFHPMFEAEGMDRSFDLPWGQADLINAVAAINPKTIVNVTAGGGFETASWINHAAALIDNFYPGQEGGQALAEVLFGERSPEGKLPITIEKNWADNPTVNSYYPNEKQTGHEHDVNFTEGLMVGYRYYTTRQKSPAYPFGFGLSYSSFALSDLQVSSSTAAVESLCSSPLMASVEVKNVGPVPAAEVVQVYIRNESCNNGCPERELKAFA